MEKTVQIVENFNWLLQPIADFTIYLFTTKSGLILCGVAIFFYFVGTVLNTMHVRRLLHRGAKSSYFPGRMSIFERIYLFFSTVGNIFGNFVLKIPVLIGVLLMLLVLTQLSFGIKEIDAYLENQKRIKELSAVVRNLDAQYKVAEISVTKMEYITYTDVNTSVEISFFDFSGNELPEKKQQVTIKGNDIYLDGIVMNFNYSEITNGERKNIAIPYRLFSNMVAQNDGVKLKIMNEKGIPEIYKRKANEIYGIEEDAYNKRLSEICEFFIDHEKARKAGVRSILGNAVHVKVKEGDKLIVSIEQTGGLVLAKEAQF